MEKEEGVDEAGVEGRVGNQDRFDDQVRADLHIREMEKEEDVDEAGVEGGVGNQDRFDDQVGADLHIRPIRRSRNRSGKIWPRIVKIDLWGKPVPPPS